VTIEQATGLLREFGFPVFVALWFMLRLEKRLDRLFELMGALLQAVALLAKSVDYHHATRDTGAQPVLNEEKEP
jgi:hypothetical protein